MTRGKHTTAEKEKDKDSDLRSRVTTVMDTLSTLCKDLEARHKELDEKEAKWKKQEERMAANVAKFNNKIQLNIGGKKFTTSKATLTSQPSSYFEAMLTSDHNQQDEDGEFFIDRNPKLFGLVLDYLRTGKLQADDLTAQQTDRLQQDFKFYQISFPTPFLCSAILEVEHEKWLLQWLPKHKFSLLYTATKDGFPAQMFHQLCNNKGPTLVVVKSQSNSIFGGYTATPWTSSNTNKNCNSAFLFTLTNPHGQPTTFPANGNSGYPHIYDHANSHACFFDLTLSANPSTTNCSSTFTGYYQDPTGLGSGISSTASSSFLASEIEVYSVTPQ